MNHEPLPAQGPVDVNVRGDVAAEFDAILRSFGPTTLDSVIDQAITRCSVKKGRRGSARKLIEAAFQIARERYTPNVELTDAARIHRAASRERSERGRAQG